MRRRSRALAPAATALALACAAAWWWTHPPDPVGEIGSHARRLVRLERVPAPELGRGFERWRMIAAGRDTVDGLWRPAAPSGGGAADTASVAPEWAVVILGGIGTDDRAALLVPDSLPVGVLALSWPWKGPREMGKLRFLASVPAIRAALLRTPGAIARGVEAVRRAHGGRRVALLGASLGAAPTVAALPLARPDALVLVDGAADLGRLLRSETGHALGNGFVAAVLAPPAAALADRLLSSFEPSRYADESPGVPTLLVDAADDRRYPKECIARLHATFPHATLAVHPGGHLEPGNRRQVASIVRSAWRWLRTLRTADLEAGGGLRHTG